jgi:hypothetical protein
VCRGYEEHSDRQSGTANTARLNTHAS